MQLKLAITSLRLTQLVLPQNNSLNIILVRVVGNVDLLGSLPSFMVLLIVANHDQVVWVWLIGSTNVN